MSVQWVTAEQYTPEWYQARLGCLTASRMIDALDYLRGGGEGAKRKKLKLDLLTEIFTGQAEPVFVNKAMQWGTDIEPQARDYYSHFTGNDVEECGFALHPTMANFGASPDGLVGADGLLEIKCPLSSSHLQTLISDRVPEQYIPQMITQCVVTGRSWCDFVSFDPRFPPEYQLFLCRFTPSTAQRSQVEAEAGKLLQEVKEIQFSIDRSQI